jgi:hypothetical protein
MDTQGKVVKQSPAPGTDLLGVRRLKVVVAVRP